MSEIQIKIQEAARAGGGILKKYFGTDLLFNEKSMAGDIVSKADLESEEKILETLEKYFPEYNILSEEIGFKDKKSNYTFVIDPLDGTNNFSLGIANFVVLIALMKDEEVIEAVAYQPILDKLYCASKDEGAFLNGKKIAVNKSCDIDKSTISFTASYDYPTNKYYKIMRDIEDVGVKRVMVNWSVGYDFCLLAEGKIEAIVNDGCEIYDYLAGKLIAKEAGAILIDFDGKSETKWKNDKFVAASNNKIADKMLEVVRLNE